MVVVCLENQGSSIILKDALDILVEVLHVFGSVNSNRDLFCKIDVIFMDVVRFIGVLTKIFNFGCQFPGFFRG